MNSIGENLGILQKRKKSHYMTSIKELHIYNDFKNQTNNVLNEKEKYNTNVLYNRIQDIKEKLGLRQETLITNKWGWISRMLQVDVCIIRLQSPSGTCKNKC